MKERNDCRHPVALDCRSRAVCLKPRCNGRSGVQMAELYSQQALLWAQMPSPRLSPCMPPNCRQHVLSTVINRQSMKQWKTVVAYLSRKKSFIMCHCRSRNLAFIIFASSISRSICSFTNPLSAFTSASPNFCNGQQDATVGKESQIIATGPVFPWKSPYNCPIEGLGDCTMSLTITLCQSLRSNLDAA